MPKRFNRKNQKPTRQYLRRSMPPAEKVLWEKLRKKQLEGFKFRRQHSIDQYIVDFYSPFAKLAIEVDGPSHFREGEKRHERERQHHIESCGITILRFSNNEIFENIEGVLKKIMEHLSE